MTVRSGNISAITATILALGVAPIAYAEPDQSWAGVFFSGTPIKDSKLLVWLDGHARFRDGAEDIDVSIVRPGIGWRVSPTVDLYVGIASVTQHRDTGDIEERRLWQQAVYQIADFAGGKLTGRTRLEQRFREAGDDTGIGVPVGAMGRVAASASAAPAGSSYCCIVDSGRSACGWALLQTSLWSLR